mmetsp:Transcript_88901/g.226215  ORF Transcript_88901/g.226215 Transcript_88901/m.226215 type:complete len:228 (-) Transcript_88901:30-713(-)
MRPLHGHRHLHVRGPPLHLADQELHAPAGTLLATLPEELRRHRHGLLDLRLCRLRQLRPGSAYRRVAKLALTGSHRSRGPGSLHVRTSLELPVRVPVCRPHHRALGLRHREAEGHEEVAQECVPCGGALSFRGNRHLRRSVLREVPRLHRCRVLCADRLHLPRPLPFGLVRGEPWCKGLGYFLCRLWSGCNGVCLVGSGMRAHGACDAASENVLHEHAGKPMVCVAQ